MRKIDERYNHRGILYKKQTNNKTFESRTEQKQINVNTVKKTKSKHQY